MLHASPEKSDLVREFGPQGLREQNGKWVYDVPKEKGGRFLQMMAPYRRADLARAQAVGRSFEKIKARDARGREIEVPMTYVGREATLAAKGKIVASGKYVVVARRLSSVTCPACGRAKAYNLMCECEV